MDKIKKVAIFKITSEAIKGARNYLDENNFYDVSLHMPHMVGVTGACENVDTLFKVDYFGKEAFLAQSNQLYLELWTPSLNNVYALVRSFRAESAVNNRHQTEFGLLELEFLGNLDQLINHISQTVRAMARRVALNCPDELKLFGRNPEELFELEFGRLTYTSVIEMLKPFYPNLSWGDDLKADHEQKVAEIYGGPVFITHYPKEIKFFNMKDNESDSRVVNSTDLILPKAGESAGAAERVTDIFKIGKKLLDSVMYHRLASLTDCNGNRKVTDDAFDWYLNAHLQNPTINVLNQLRDYYETGVTSLVPKDVPLHSGTGIGMARVLQFLLNLDDIREACVYPRNAVTIE